MGEERGREYVLYRSTSGKIDILRHSNDDPPTYEALGERWERQGSPARAHSWVEAERILRAELKAADSQQKVSEMIDRQVVAWGEMHNERIRHRKCLAYTQRAHAATITQARRWKAKHDAAQTHARWLEGIIARGLHILMPITPSFDGTTEANFDGMCAMIVRQALEVQKDGAEAAKENEQLRAAMRLAEHKVDQAINLDQGRDGKTLETALWILRDALVTPSAITTPLLADLAALRADNARLRAALETRERQLRLVQIVAHNHAMNTHGGVGTGDKAAQRMSLALANALLLPLPQWTADDAIVGLPTLEEQEPPQ